MFAPRSRGLVASAFTPQGPGVWPAPLSWSRVRSVGPCTWPRVNVGTGGRARASERLGRRWRVAALQPVPKKPLFRVWV